LTVLGQKDYILAKKDICYVGTKGLTNGKTQKTAVHVIPTEIHVSTFTG